MELDRDEFTEVFRDELESANYVVVGDPESLFDDPSAWEAELLVGGVVKDIEANICFPWGQIGDWDTAKGAAFIKVEWQIYHRLGRKVVYKKMTEGSSHLPESSPTGVSDLLLEAFAVATRNLLADPEFHDLVAKGAPVSPRPSFAELRIKKSVLFKGPIQGHISDVRIGVATVFAGDGHGSGFFVSSDGALLTNAHVVGGAKFVKVKIATGRELLGEVLRKDAVRDIALIRVEETRLIPLPIRVAEANVGEEVYCIGSPLDEKFSTTMSRGIVSGYRVEDNMKYLQSDVNVLPGSSGGPLLDSNGNVIGLTVGGITLARAPAGLNFFIPINEALESLNVKLEPDRLQTEWGIASSGLREPQAPKAPEKRVAHVPKEVKKPEIRKLYLRSTPMSVADSEVGMMIRKYNFFVRRKNEGGDFVNDFVDNGDGTITDRATWLMWEKGGSSSPSRYVSAKKYVSRLNRVRFSGKRDWRIPTTEELASLLERDRNNKGLHISPLFDARQKECWTSDSSPSSVPALQLNPAIDFSDGSIDSTKVRQSNVPTAAGYEEDQCFIRAVRSIR
jgi:S1-C subfamily serine protease